jgi:hypothetical protein
VNYTPQKLTNETNWKIDELEWLCLYILGHYSSSQLMNEEEEMT